MDGVFHFLLWSSKLPLAFLVSSAARKGKTELCFGCAHLELWIESRWYNEEGPQRIRFDGEWWQGHCGRARAHHQGQALVLVAVSALVTIFLNFFFRFYLFIYSFTLQYCMGGVPNRLILSRHSGCIFGNVLFLSLFQNYTFMPFCEQDLFNESLIKNVLVGVSWCSTGLDSAPPLQRAQVRSLVRELRSHMPLGRRGHRKRMCLQLRTLIIYFVYMIWEFQY